MKKLLSFLLLILAACSKYTEPTVNVKPDAKFSFKGDSAAPEAIVFTNLSASATPYRWSFGDSTFQTSYSNDTVSHVYADAGTYTVMLTSYAETDSASSTQTITLVPVKTKLSGLGFTSIPDSAGNYFIDTLPVTIVPNLRASGPVTYKVDHGDGVTDTSLQHLYTGGPGSYQVKVTVKSKYGEDSASTNVELYTIGEKKYGGAIFHINADGHGYVAAANAVTTTLSWGCNNYQIAVTDTAMGSGLTNTQGIIDSCGNNTIAYYSTQLNINGYTDWYLPSVVELRTLAPLIGINTADGYVTSSESDAANYMSDLPAGSGTPVPAPKVNSSTLMFIPVRKF